MAAPNNNYGSISSNIIEYKTHESQEEEEGEGSMGGENLRCLSEILFKTWKDLSLTRLSQTEKPQKGALLN